MYLFKKQFETKEKIIGSKGKIMDKNKLEQLKDKNKIYIKYKIGAKMNCFKRAYNY